MNSCAVIIVNYNTGKLLSQVIDCVIKAEGVDEIIVVDNNSSDNSMEQLPNSSKIKKHYRKQNHGFGASCNYGATLTQADYMLFLNPDCLIGKNSVSLCLETFKQNRKAGIVGVRVNNPDGSEQRATRRRLPTFWRAMKSYTKIENLANYCNCFAGVNLSHQPMPKTTQKVEAISGAFIMIKADVFNELNGFDEEYPMHFEDLDLFKRTFDNGNEVVFNPNICVIHHQGTSSKTNPEVSQMKKKGLVLYFCKHHTPFIAGIIKNISRFT